MLNEWTKDMNCHESKRRLDLFLDGELNVDVKLEVLQHLNRCPSCARICEGEKELRSLLRDNLGRDRAPEGLRNRVQELVGRRPPLRLHAFAATAAIVFVSVFLLLPPAGARSLEAVVSAAVEHHARVRGDIFVNSTPEEDLVPYGDRGCLHDLSAHGIEFRNVSSTERVLRGRMVCWTTHMDKITRKRVSHASVPAAELGSLEGGERKGAFRVFEREGRVVIVSFCGKSICIFVADDQSEANRVTAALAQS